MLPKTQLYCWCGISADVEPTPRSGHPIGGPLTRVLGMELELERTQVATDLGKGLINSNPRLPCRETETKERR